MKIESLITAFAELNEYQKNKFLMELFNQFDLEPLHISHSYGKHVNCPHCKSFSIRGNGFTKGRVQKYFCNSCKKNFSENTHKVFWWIKKKDLMIKYMRGLLSGLTIRKNATVCGISINTSFIWRHKLLNCLIELDSDKFKGILELDQLQFNWSDKGLKKDSISCEESQLIKKSGGVVSVLAATDRDENKLLKVVTLGSPTIENISHEIENKLDKVLLICSKNRSEIIGYFKKSNRIYKCLDDFKNPKLTESNLHLDNLVKMENRFRRFLRPKRGVATKYLENYIHWFFILEVLQNRTDRRSRLAHIILSSSTANRSFKDISKKHKLLRTKLLFDSITKIYPETTRPQDFLNTCQNPLSPQT